MSKCNIMQNVIEHTLFSPLFKCFSNCSLPKRQHYTHSFQPNSALFVGFFSIAVLSSPFFWIKQSNYINCVHVSHVCLQAACCFRTEMQLNFHAKMYNFLAPSHVWTVECDRTLMCTSSKVWMCDNNVTHEGTQMLALWKYVRQSMQTRGKRCRHAGNAHVLQLHVHIRHFKVILLL